MPTGQDEWPAGPSEAEGSSAANGWSNLDEGQRQRWGEQVARAGATSIPNLLLDHQTALDLSSTELVLLLHLLRYWVRPQDNPWPQITAISRAMDLQPHGVERTLRALEHMGYVRKLEDGYDLSGLRERLMAIARPEPARF